MKKCTKKWCLFLLACLGTFALQAQTDVGDLSSLDDFGGVGIADLNDFGYTLGDFTLEAQGTKDTEISIANGLIKYTPTDNGTIRFAQKDGVIFVFENRAYKGILTHDADAIDYPDVFAEADDNTAEPKTGIYNPKNLFLNPGFETGTDGNAVTEGTQAQDWTRSGTNNSRCRINLLTNREGQSTYMLHQSGGLSQDFTGRLKSNTPYKMQIRTWSHNNDNQSGGSWYVGFGSIEKSYEIFQGTFTKGRTTTNVQADETFTFITKDLTGYSTVCFSVYAYQGTNQDPLSHYDRMTLVEGSFIKGIVGVTTATFLSGTAYAPEVDKSELHAKITDAKVLLGTNDGTKPGYSVLNDVVSDSESVYSDPDATLAEVLDAIDDLDAAMDDYTNVMLSDLQVGGVSIAGFAPTTFTYTYYVAPGTVTSSVVSATAATETAGASIGYLPDATASVPGGVTVTVTAGDGTTTQDYTVNFVINYMAGWDGNRTTDTPADAGWIASDGTITWGAPQATSDAQEAYYRTNAVDRYAFYAIPSKNENIVTYAYPVSLTEGKIYSFTGANWRRNGQSAAMNVTFSISSTVDANGTILATQTQNCNAGSYFNYSFEFATPKTGTYYFIRYAQTTGGIQDGSADFMLLETGDAIRVTFNTNGGTPAIDSQYVISGGKVTEPAGVSKDGFNLLGWYTIDPDDLWDFETGVTADITLTAKWDIASSISITTEGQAIKIVAVEGGLNITASQATQINVVSVVGQIVASVSANAGDTFIQLPAGMYIVNGQKAIVK